MLPRICKENKNCWTSLRQTSPDKCDSVGFPFNGYWPKDLLKTVSTDSYNLYLCKFNQKTVAFE